MNNAREIAERVLKIQERGKFEHLNFGDHQFKESASVELARAYLELEKKFNEPAKCNGGHETLPLSLWDCPECTEILRKEITKLKEIIKKDEFCEHREIVLKLKEENDKLKKSREVLRKAVDFYGDINSWDRDGFPKGFCAIFNSLKDDHTKENLSSYAGKKAREAIKADDEIMGNSFKIDSNIYKAPVDGWYSFPGGMFRLSDKQPTELINGEYGIEPKEYLEKIAYKKED